ERVGWNAREHPRAPGGPSVGVEASLHDGHVAVRGDPPDDRDGKSPALADLAHGRGSIGPDDRAHALLALRDHHLERGHHWFPARHRVEVDDDAGPGSVRRLRGRTRETAGTEVLEALDEAALDELEARLDEQLLREGIADLDRRPLGRIIMRECR